MYHFHTASLLIIIIIIIIIIILVPERNTMYKWRYLTSVMCVNGLRQ